MEVIIGILVFIGVIATVSLLVVGAMLGGGSWIAKRSPYTPLSDEEYKRLNEERKDRAFASYQAELIARASKNPDGKVTRLDEINARHRHMWW